MRTAILHIGTEKTGTTSIQRFLDRNRDRLLARGFAYPRSAGRTDSRNLVLHAMAPARCEDLHREAGLADEEARRAFRRAFERSFAAELGALPGRARTVLLSSEHCHSRLTRPEEVDALVRLLRRHVDRVEILVYLRRQDRVAVSLHSAALKAGQPSPPLLPAVDGDDVYFDHAALLERWAAACGREHVHPRVFAPGDWTGGSLIADFGAACGIGETAGLVAPAPENQSITAEAQAFLAAINPFVPPYVDGAPNPERGPLAELVTAAFPGRGRLPSRAAAMGFAARFARGNETVRRLWFPQRASLFDDDFSGYPETETAAPDGAAAVVTVAAGLWRRCAGELRRLEAEVAFRTGRTALAKKRPDAAAACFRRALELDPGHGGARAQLARLAAPRRRRAFPRLLRGGPRG